MTTSQVKLGVGIYSRTDAARLLGINPPRLRRWVSGYTYWLLATSTSEKRRKPPVIKTDLPPIQGAIALSFLELMELRVVKSIVDAGIPLQHVRRAAKWASDAFGTDHPFASQRVFTDGRSIFSAVSTDDPPNIVKWEKGQMEQIIAGPVLDRYLSEIEFDPSTSLAYKWWPLGKTNPVILDPRVAFGSPVIEGTAVRTSIVARLAKRSSVTDAAVAYELQLRQAEAAINFEASLAAA
ncbi:MAG: DUF433 domain-containing protein [Gemmatimonadaceae bacterium]